MGRAFAALIVCLVVVIAVVMLSVQYGRALESCHADGTRRVPITGC